MKSQEDYKQEALKRAAQGPDAVKGLPDYAREELRKAIEEDGLSADQAREMMNTILLGIEEGLREAGMEAKLILIETIDAFIFVFGDIFEQTWDALKSYARSLRDLAGKATSSGAHFRQELERWIKEHEKDGKA